MEVGSEGVQTNHSFSRAFLRLVRMSIHVNVLTERKGQPYRVRVSGGSTRRCIFDFHGKSYFIDLTLNGDYTRTPNKAYSMLKEPSPAVLDEGEGSLLSLSYQVLLLENPPKAEFQIFKFHECPVIKDDTCESLLHLPTSDFQILSEIEPREIVDMLDTLSLPESVSRFLLQAKKCTSS